MKNIALILAGGTGKRTGQEIPKQFLSVENKPILIYTLEAFERHPGIDAVTVVCVDGWQEILRAYVRQFNISKLESVVAGGTEGQDSIRNGLTDIATRHQDPDDIVLIHDGIRPLVSAEIISDNIRVCREHGNAVTVVPCTSAMLRTYDNTTASEQVSRDHLKNTQTPQTFFLSDLLQAHRDALNAGITATVSSATMYIELGRTLHFAHGSEKNLKITTTDDIDLFSALLRTERPDWMR